MNFKDLEKFIDSCHGTAAIIIPIGCMEEHGPHLPLSTDGMLAMAFAEAVARDGSVPIIAGPLVDFGVSVLTQGFPGTMKVRFDTLKALLVDVMRSCVAWGFTKIILWTWHGGSSHEICLREASLAVVRKNPDANVFILRGVKLFDDLAFMQKIKAIVRSEGDHADELETSLMLHKHEALVKMEKAIKEMPRLPRFKVIPDGRGVLEHGIVGDPTLATKEKGKAIFDCILGELEHHVRSMIDEK